MLSGKSTEKVPLSVFFVAPDLLVFVKEVRFTIISFNAYTSDDLKYRYQFTINRLMDLQNYNYSFNGCKIDTAFQIKVQKRRLRGVFYIPAF